MAESSREPALLSPGERAARRQDLLAERSRAVHRLASLRRSVDELVDAADLEPPDDEHDPDGTTAYERAQLISLADEAATLLEGLDQALDAVDDPSYGACSQCGRPIGLARLRAVPTTTTCVSCAAAGRR